MAATKSDKFNFEAALNELNSLAEEMEHGELELEVALKRFETGVKLIRKCQTALKTAEQKVEILQEKGQEATLAPFEVTAIKEE
ncbi:MAG: exodeoxyribonuclease VII small subunit [Gammaproteobacteria bacterium]|nr:exodeoxyribonuclease VII small subunit [Gammaproteobacteria bacterium]